EFHKTNNPLTVFALAFCHVATVFYQQVSVYRSTVVSKLVDACYGAKTLSAEPRRSFSNELNFKWLNWFCNQEPL
ncbi:hypothetical protein ACEWJW_26945, partial [Escherichia coli]